MRCTEVRWYRIDREAWKACGTNASGEVHALLGHKINRTLPSLQAVRQVRKAHTEVLHVRTSPR